MINTVAMAKSALPLKWRDQPSANGKGKMAFAIMGGDKSTGDITIVVALEDGAQAPSHEHDQNPLWPIVESITCLSGILYGVVPTNPDFALIEGKSIDLRDGAAHAPYVPEGGFALIIYRQPGGSRLVEAPTAEAQG